MKNNISIIQYKYVLSIFSLLFVLLSCEKDTSLTIPDDQKDMSVAHEEVKRVVTNLGGDDIWLVDSPVAYPSENGISFSTLGRIGFLSPFFLAYEFKPNNTLNIYSTIDFEGFIETRSDDNQTVFPDNPNTYRVGGTLRNELTIESKGILSSLKRYGRIDFEYLVKDYNKDTILLESFYSDVSVKNFYLRRYNKTDFFNYIQVARKLFKRYIFYWSDGTFLPYLSTNTIAKIELLDGAGNQIDSFSSNEYAFLLPDLIHQNYDTERQIFNFRYVDIIQYIDPDEIFNPIREFSGKIRDTGVRYFDIESSDDQKITLVSYNSQKTYRLVIVIRILVTGVSLNKPTLSIKIGTTETLVAAITPEDATNPKVFWESDNTAVATVNQEGEVEAVSEGEATITVTTEDGGKTTEANITVIL